MKPKMFELYFNLLYLLTSTTLGVLLLTKKTSFYWGIMALILAFGDSAHLLPRIYQIKTKKKVPRAIGYGKMLTSIAMSVFYVFLWEIGVRQYSESINSLPIYFLCFIRIVLCVLPQNRWSQINPTYIWGIYRNIPFVLQGLMVYLLFYLHRFDKPSLAHIHIAILLSFLCYIPVVLWASKKPAIGMLMLPKTLCYVWIIAIGFYL